MNISFINRFSRRNIIILGIFLVVLLGLILNYYVFGHGRVKIPTAEVRRGEILITQTETGEVRASKNQTITAPASTRRMSNLQIVDMIPEGTTVEKGDVLIQFDTSEMEDLINQREESLQSLEENLEKLEAQQASTMEDFNADLETINNNFELANLTFENMRYESESKRQEAKLQYDNAKLNYDAQITRIENQKIINRVDKNNRLRQIEESKNDLEWAKAQLKRLIVTAPSPGLVVYKETFSVGTFEKVEIGDNVFPQQPLIELPDLTEIQVKMRVNEIDVDKYEKGQEVSVTLDAYPEELFTGIVTEISPLVEGYVKNIRLFNIIMTLKEKNNPMLRPGFTARAEIVLKKMPDALYVPVEAVFEKEGNPIVFTKGSGYKHKEVTIGERNENYIVILDNLEEGEEVALIDPTGNAERLGTALELQLRLERRKEIIERFLAGPALPEEKRARSGIPEQATPEIMGDYLKELLQDPEIKKEYYKMIEKDPEFEKDTQKRTQFYMEMLQKIREKE